jgi:chromosome partitioning protein
LPECVTLTRVVTVTIANQKGGVGKSTTARALGALLSGSRAQSSRRVLLIDLDPQASLSAMCGVTDTADLRGEGRNMYDVLGGASPGRATLREIARPLSDTLALAPADIALASGEIGLTSRMGRESVLRKALATVASSYDVALIDCPPSLGILTINGLTAARGVLVPTLPQIADLRGVALFMSTLDTIRAELNPQLEVIGVLPVMFDGRYGHHNEAIETMRSAGLPLLPVAIGRSVKVAESAGAGQSVTDYAPDNARANEYRELERLIDQWLRERE